MASHHPRRSSLLPSFFLSLLVFMALFEPAAALLSTAPTASPTPLKHYIDHYLKTPAASPRPTYHSFTHPLIPTLPTNLTKPLHTITLLFQHYLNAIYLSLKHYSFSSTPEPSEPQVSSTLLDTTIIGLAICVGFVAAATMTHAWNVYWMERKLRVQRGRREEMRGREGERRKSGGSIKNHVE